MPYVNKKLARLNSFKPYKLPTARKLFERYGFSLTQAGHPDNTDPFKFSTPGNLQGIIPNSGVVGLGASLVSRYPRPEPADPAPADPEPADPAPADQ